jgi:GT2 family glycosyltransferase
MVSPAIESKIKYSVVIPVHNNASDLQQCLASLHRQTCDHDLFEVIVVDNNSTDETVSVAETAGVKCLREEEFQSSYAARNRGIRAAQGEFVAFIDSDCIAHVDWLSSIDARSGDATVGCFAGEILSVKPTTTVERFSDKIGLLRQQGPLSGWHFKPYAQTANAIYRKVVFERIGHFDPTMKSGGDAVLAWRMLDETDYRIDFIPEAIVYHHHRTSVPDLWAQFRRYGGGKLNWALAQADYQPPAVATLEADLIAAFDKLVGGLEASGGSTEELVFPLLQSITQVAHYSGYLQEMLRLMSGDVPPATWPRVASGRATTCNICDSRAFVRGPGGRLARLRRPQCLQCGSLERHRVVHEVLGAMDSAELARSTCLFVGETLPAWGKRFARSERRNVAELGVAGASAAYDFVVAMNGLSRLSNEPIEDVLAALVSPLKDDGLLILVDRIPDRAGNGFAADWESRIAQCLPNVSVRSSLVPDRATGVIKIVTLASPDASQASLMALRWPEGLNVAQGSPTEGGPRKSI